MSNHGQGLLSHFYLGFVCCVLIYKAQISGERLQDHWSYGFFLLGQSFIAGFGLSFISMSDRSPKKSEATVPT